MVELFSTRLGAADEVELTTEEVDTPINATTAQAPTKEPTKGLPEGPHEEAFVVTWYIADDDEAPSKRKKSRRKPAAKKTAAKKTTRKKTAAKKTTAKK